MLKSFSREPKAAKAAPGVAVPKAAAAAPAKPSFLSKLWPFRRNKTSAAQRRHTRHECCIIATMTLVDRHIELDGLVLEISRGGASFRTATTYILMRDGEEVMLRIEGQKCMGTIVASRPTGYGVRFNEALDPDFVDRVAEEFGIAAANGFAARAQAA